MKKYLTQVKHSAFYGICILMMTQCDPPINSESAEISIITKQSKNCSAAELNRMKPISELSPWDTFCTSIKLSYLDVKTASPKVSETINKKLLQILCENTQLGHSCNSVEDFLNIPDNSDGFECEVSFTPLFNENNILSISCNSSVYGFGAAHPISSTNFVNFDLRTANIISLEDIMIDEFRRPLSLMAKKKVLDNYPEDVFDLNDDFEITNNFSIQSDGLHFLYNTYEIGPYSSGPISISFTYQEIQYLLNPNAITTVFLKKTNKSSN